MDQKEVSKKERKNKRKKEERKKNDKEKRSCFQSLVVRTTNPKKINHLVKPI